MIVSQLISRLQEIPAHYTVLIWDSEKGEWSEDLSDNIVAENRYIIGLKED